MNTTPTLCPEATASMTIGKESGSDPDLVLSRRIPLCIIPALTNDSLRDKVDWDGLDDPDNPKNWTDGKRWRITILNSLFMFVSPVSSSMVAPAFQAIKSDLVIKSEFQTQMVLSVFILASAVGPLIISPLSEVYGRRPVLHVTCLIYAVFNLSCAFSKTSAQLLIFR